MPTYLQRPANRWRVYLMQDIRAASDVEEPVRDMLLVCERFRVVYQSGHPA